MDSIFPWIIPRESFLFGVDKLCSESSTGFLGRKANVMWQCEIGHQRREFNFLRREKSQGKEIEAHLTHSLLTGYTSE